MIERLLLLASNLAREGTRSSATQRRAVSTAYYAVFHALAQLCADELLGRGLRRKVEYEKVYRSLDHGSLRSAFNNAPLKGHEKLEGIGLLIVKLQIERHRSDYLPPKRLYNGSQCADLIHHSRQIVEELQNLNADERRTLAISLLFKNRPS